MNWLQDSKDDYVYEILVSRRCLYASVQGVLLFMSGPEMRVLLYSHCPRPEPRWFILIFGRSIVDDDNAETNCRILMYGKFCRWMEP